MRTTRRRFVIGLVAALTIGNLVRLLSPRSATNITDALLAALPNRASARAIGTVFLAKHGDKISADQLLRDILGTERAAPSNDLASVRLYLRDRIRDDFARAQTVELDGWVLSLTEVRLCALATLQA